jgi:hypothetical protein
MSKKRGGSHPPAPPYYFFFFLFFFFILYTYNIKKKYLKNLTGVLVFTGPRSSFNLKLPAAYSLP